MNRHEWRLAIYQRSTDPERLRAFVRRHADVVFDENDQRVMRLANSWDWPRVAAGVRAESRQMRGEPYDPNAVCFNPKDRLYHVVRRIMAPVNVITGLKAKRLNRVSL
jgi:hypothetical protein